MNTSAFTSKHQYNEAVDASLQSLLPPKYSGGDADVDNPVEIFHEHTKFHRSTFAGHYISIAKYIGHPQYIARSAAGYKTYPFLEKLELPPPGALEITLSEVLRKRRSCRSFEPLISLEETSTLLHHALRVNQVLRSQASPTTEIHFRPYPSPGGLNGLEVYAFLNGVAGVDPCIVHYDSRNHVFRVIKRQSGDALHRAEISEKGQIVASPLAIVLTMVTQRQTSKYGGRGYRLNLLEAGHASQNLCLVAEGLGLSTLPSGAYYDDELAEAIGVDGVTESIGSVIKIGRRDEKAAPASGRGGKYEL